MTLDEKIMHLQETVMTEARAEGNAIIDNHRNTLESLFEKHKEEAERQSEIRIQSETTNAKRQLNQAAAKAQTELKRAMGKCQTELKARLFDEVKELLIEFTKTEEYLDYLTKLITQAAVFSEGKGLTLYINPSDEEKREELEDRTGMTISISNYDFMGGLRAVIQERNILIDHSFQTALEAEYQKFQFGTGGVGVA